MNTAMAKEELEKILDQAVQDVTECTAGVQLHQGDQMPGEDLCTVQITFDRGFRTSLTLCADTRLLYHMACNSFHEEAVEPEDVEEFSKEYFNVLCGKIAGAMFHALVRRCSITGAMSRRGVRYSLFLHTLMSAMEVRS